MGLFSEVKCGRCDRRYSGFRSRCPYCGVRRNKKSKRASDTDSSTLKLVIGILVLVVLIVAVVILLITSIGEGKEESAAPEASPTFSEDDGVNSVESSAPPVEETPTPTPSAEPSEEPAAESLQSLIMTYAGSELSACGDPSYNYDVSMALGESIKLGYVATPESDQYTANWVSSDENVAVVLSTGEVTAVADGTAVITLTVENISVTCVIRVG